MDLKVIANDFRETISAAKRKFIHGSPAITFEKKNLKIDSRSSVLETVSAAEIASRKSLAINFETSSFSNSQMFFLGIKAITLKAKAITRFFDFRILILA